MKKKSFSMQFRILVVEMPKIECKWSDLIMWDFN